MSNSPRVGGKATLTLNRRQLPYIIRYVWPEMVMVQDASHPQGATAHLVLKEGSWVQAGCKEALWKL